MSARKPLYKLTVTYWLGTPFKPLHSDAQTPLTYKLGSWRGEETHGYNTRRGYLNHVARIRNEIAANGRIIAEYKVTRGGDDNEGGSLWTHHIVYRPMLSLRAPAFVGFQLHDGLLFCCVESRAHNNAYCH